MLCLFLCAHAGKYLTRLKLAVAPRLAYERERLVLASTSDGKGGASWPGVRHWVRYCLWGRGVSPVRSVDEASSRWEKIDEETLVMDFTLWLVYCDPTGRGISPKTAQQYVYQVQSWHRVQPKSGGSLGGGIELRRWKALCKALRKEIGDGKPRRRWGVRTQHLAQAMRQELAGGTATEQNWRAALTVAFCGLMRGGEFALQDQQIFESVNCLTRADVRFFRSQGVLHAAVQMRQLKTTRSLRGKPVEMVLRGGGTLIDPVAELWRLFELDPVAEVDRESTPLFRMADGCAFKVSGVRAMVKALMASVGCDPRRFGAHSLRIGGATAALAAGVDPAVIRCMGRWSSDVYEIYMRLSREAAARVSTVVASTGFHDMERGFQTDALDEAVRIPMLDADMDE